MSIFKRKKIEAERLKNSIEFECSSIYVLTTFITSNLIAPSFPSPVMLNLYLLAKKDENGNFYELFTGKEIKSEKAQHEYGCISLNFNEPYFTKIESFSDYLTNPKMKTVTSSLLFDFLLDLNMPNYIHLLDKKYSNTEDLFDEEE